MAISFPPINSPERALQDPFNPVYFVPQGPPGCALTAPPRSNRTPPPPRTPCRSRSITAPRCATLRPPAARAPAKLPPFDPPFRLLASPRRFIPNPARNSSHKNHSAGPHSQAGDRRQVNACTFTTRPTHLILLGARITMVAASDPSFKHTSVAVNSTQQNAGPLPGRRCRTSRALSLRRLLLVSPASLHGQPGQIHQSICMH